MEALHDPTGVPRDRRAGGRGQRTAGTMDRVVRERSIIICCGSGGVGKTTTAAAFALQAARLGRRACVVTIDPARRLANSLGLDTLNNRPTRIEGPWPGELHALMLDPKGTFDDLIQRYSDSAEQVEDIKVNRIYRNLTGVAVGHPGVHGHGEALRAGRGRRRSTWWWWTPLPPATPSTSSTPRGG